MNWEAVTALGTAFTGVVIFATVVIGWRELDHVMLDRDFRDELDTAVRNDERRHPESYVLMTHELSART